MCITGIFWSDNIRPAYKCMDGKIVKTHRGIFYADADRVIPCKARGLFRDQGLKPTVGDNVRLRISEEDGSGYIEEVYPRKNQLLRPYVSNVDHVMIVMSVHSPDINPYLLDRFLLMCTKSQVEAIIVVNKSDLLSEEDREWIRSIYEPIGYPLFLTSVVERSGIEEVRNLILGKTTVFAGPSGVGKSSLLHAITGGKWQPETGEISNRTRRGKHTTRHAELFHFEDDTFLVDTPGFSSLDITFLEDEREIKTLMPDFIRYADCRFNDCNHIEEPGCGVKHALANHLISPIRYENYKLIYHERKSMKMY